MSFNVEARDTHVDPSRQNHQPSSTAAARRVVGNRYIMLIDLASVFIGLYGAYTNMVTVELPPHLKQAGHTQFLTNLSLLYSISVFALGFVAHLTGSPTLFTIKNNIHPIGLALEVIVAGVYWPLRLFFLELLTKDPSNFQLSLATDLSIHLMPVVSLLVDYLVFMPRWTISNNTALFFVVLLTVLYWFLLRYLVDVDHGASYPYAFMDVERDSQRVAVFVAVALVAFASFLYMRKVYDWVVGVTEEYSAEIDKKLK